MEMEEFKEEIVTCHHHKGRLIHTSECTACTRLDVCRLAGFTYSITPCTTALGRTRSSMQEMVLARRNEIARLDIIDLSQDNDTLLRALLLLRL